MSHVHTKGRRIPCASLFLAALSIAFFGVRALPDAMQYDRSAIAAGEWWRIVSGHWAHYTYDHLFWDTTAFALLASACERRSRPRLLACVIGSTLTISLSLWCVLPSMSVYRGLSGIDSALFVLLAAEMWQDGQHSPWSASRLVPVAAVILFVLKSGVELATGETLFVSNLGLGVRAVPLAHIAGAATAAIVFIAARACASCSRAAQGFPSVLRFRRGCGRCAPQNP